MREVGPDRAAAEWVLRLGGTVKFRDLEFWSSDYNRLPSEPRERMKVEAIDAAGVAITDNGLEHLSMYLLHTDVCMYLVTPPGDIWIYIFRRMLSSSHSFCLCTPTFLGHKGLTKNGYECKG